TRHGGGSVALDGRAEGGRGALTEERADGAARRDELLPAVGEGPAHVRVRDHGERGGLDRRVSRVGATALGQDLLADRDQLATLRSSMALTVHLLTRWREQGGRFPSGRRRETSYGRLRPARWRRVCCADSRRRPGGGDGSAPDRDRRR